MYYLGKSTESFPCDLSAKIMKLELVVYTVLQKKFMSQLFVCSKGSWRWYACCLTDVSVFADFPLVTTPLCELPCGGVL